MLKWLFGKARNRVSASPLSQFTVAEDDELLNALPSATSKLLVGIPAMLRGMSVTPAASAAEELENRNVSRRQLYGNQAVDVPIQQGNGRAAFVALLRCVAADHRVADVSRVAVEEVAATGQVEPAVPERPDLTAGDRAYYQKRLAKHMRKKGQASPHSGHTRKLVVTVYLRDTFARHEILRTGDDAFYVMVCTKR